MIMEATTDLACPIDSPFHPGQVVVITNVDQYGFCGREHHPDPSDMGIAATVRVIEVCNDHDGEEDLTYTCLTCVTLEPDPRVLELIDFEVKILN